MDKPIRKNEAEKEFSTPMMKQYSQVKRQYRDCLLFYRMGDFYELFFDDALIGAQVLNITLTHKRGGADGDIPMAGVPFHAVNSYLNKLVKAGYKIALCEQVSLPSRYGLVDREVVRVVTPGTVVDETALVKKENNFIVSVLTTEKSIGISAADISTGYFATVQVNTDNIEKTLIEELSKLNPSECILPSPLYNKGDLLHSLKKITSLNIFPFFDWEDYAEKADEILKRQLKVTTLSSFDFDEKPLAKQSAAALLGYLKRTQKSDLSHIKKIDKLSSNGNMVLDRSTMVNLELFSTIHEHNIKGSLLFVIDETQTAMGGRLIKQWLLKPLLKKDEIIKRQSAIDYLIKNASLKDNLIKKFSEINDIERILSKLSINIGSPRDVVNLKNSLQKILEVKKIINHTQSPFLNQISKQIDEDIDTLVNLIEKNILPEPPISLHEGGIINAKVDQTLDLLRKTITGSKEWIIKMEQKERKATGINSLKVRFNKIFGFYIEISKTNLAHVPKKYIRKQTLVNGERFITDELKQHEEIILTAEEKINKLEYDLYCKTIADILSFTAKIQNATSAIAQLDCILSFTLVSEKNHYVKPELTQDDDLYIENGRHPVVEQLLENSRFVPNTTFFNTAQRLLIITGPNMAGKSVYIRQTALIVLLAQIGMFVPATRAKIGIVDRIFVRSGASDIITSNLSTFMVEMVETAYILNNATEKSLIIMDEIGRGTSTYDGISIAWAIAEYLATHFPICPRTLFATHYHELQKLADNFAVIKNFQMSVQQHQGEPVFLHSVIEGGASASFGVAVAKLAGVPVEVIEKANKLLQSFEQKLTTQKSNKNTLLNSFPNNLNTNSISEHLIAQELDQMDISNTTPLEALNILAKLKNKLMLMKTFHLKD